MLFENDVVADGEAEPGPFSGRFCCEEWIEHLFLHVWRNPGAIVPDSDFDPIPEVLGRSSERRFVVTSVRFCSAPICCVKAIRNQIEQNPGDVLREDIGLASARIERPAWVAKFLTSSICLSVNGRTSVR